MKRKTLIILLSVLCVLLLGETVFVFVMQFKGPGEDQAVSSERVAVDSAERTEPSEELPVLGETEPVEETLSTGETAPTGPEDPTDDSDPTEATKTNNKNPAKPTEPELDADLSLAPVPPEMTGPAKPTQPPAATTPPPTEPATPPAATEPPAASKPSQGQRISYETYKNMSAAEQSAYRATFNSLSDFFAWYNAAKAEYDKKDNEIDVGDGSIDLGDLINGSGNQ